MFRWPLIAACFALGCGAGSAEGERNTLLASTATYHLPNDANAMSVRFDSGTFRFGADMCDAVQVSAGRVEERPSGAAVLVADEPFIWPIARESSLFYAPIDQVSVVEASDTTLTVAGVHDGRSFEQVWMSGGVCIECSRDGVHSCEEPLLEWPPD